MPRITYLRDEKNRPVGCIAIDFDRNSGIVKYQLSVANPHDEFNKLRARDIALGRLTKEPLTVSVDQQANMHVAAVAIMQELARTCAGSVPTRAVKAARYWLTNPKKKS